MSPMKVMIDYEKCTGHGRCYSLAPDVFGTDDRGYGEVLAPEVAAAHESQARLAAANCPEGAISIEP